ncbi:MAG: hypothetical protein E7316_01655 [Clostridiales bacterium]|nr:hypothetical protein [Clostridiales bacterium]
MGIASLILAILALVMLIWGGVVVKAFGLLAAIIGLILGAVGRKNPDKRGVSTAGMVICIVILAIALIAVIAVVACGASLLSSGYYY